jgi:hypothetical protein
MACLKQTQTHTHMCTHNHMQVLICFLTCFGNTFAFWSTYRLVCRHISSFLNTSKIILKRRKVFNRMNFRTNPTNILVLRCLLSDSYLTLCTQQRKNSTRTDSLTQAMMEGTTAKVKVQNELSESFRIQNGLRQGDALACILFNIAWS